MVNFLKKIRDIDSHTIVFVTLTLAILIFAFATRPLRQNMQTYRLQAQQHCHIMGGDTTMGDYGRIYCEVPGFSEWRKAYFEAYINND
jgi:hypothetical protein